jgi:hypothetical protein
LGASTEGDAEDEIRSKKRAEFRWPLPCGEGLATRLD